MLVEASNSSILVNTSACLGEMQRIEIGIIRGQTDGTYRGKFYSCYSQKHFQTADLHYRVCPTFLQLFI